MKTKLLAFVAVAFLLTPFASAQEKHWYKGNVHTHTLWSDGDDFPEMAAEWYKSRGYDFLALSDHNVLSVGERWMAVRDIVKRGGQLPIDKYRKRFPDVIETRHTTENGEEIRLQPLTKVRELLEEQGKFILMPAEEVTDGFEKKPVHIGAVNLAEKVKPLHGNSVQEVMRNNLKAIEEEAQRTGVPAVAHINHPNFGWGVTADDLANVVEARYVEVYNGHPGVNHTGSTTRPSVEKMWDIANTVRLDKLNTPPIMGFGTDDTHHYHVPGMKRSTAGRGWTMVYAEKLEPNAIIAAYKAGDFYASSGVTLKSVGYDPANKTIALEIAPDGDATFTTEFIGTPKGSTDAGKVFAKVEGTKASYTLKGEELYVRATVTSSKPADNPSFEGQLKQAWTQPVGWKVGEVTERVK